MVGEADRAVCVNKRHDRRKITFFNFLCMSVPLAERMRPRNFDEFIGQEEIVGKGKLLRKLIENDELFSLIFWGPPGVGKTTLARIIAEQTKSRFVALSGVMSGKEDLRKIVDEAQRVVSPPFQGGAGVVAEVELTATHRKANPSVSPLGKGRIQTSQRTILFIDEIHRWNKAQQDALLPYVEQGIVTLIGATTENPSFEIIGALLSRSRVFILKYLTEENIVSLLKRALEDKDRGFGEYKIEIEAKTLELLAELAGGDARVALNALEMAVKAKIARPLPTLSFAKERDDSSSPPQTEGPPRRVRGREERSHGREVIVNNEDIKEALQRTHLVFDKKGEEFYNLISALHKSMRGSDANASLYWLARMLEGGADPLYVARRVLRFASEDIGMANSAALVQAEAAFEACDKIGYPECTVHLAQAVVYCAKSAKSNLLYTAYQKAAEDAKNTSHLGVPIHLRNAPTKFMKEIGYGKDYKYNPDYDEPVIQEYLPDELRGRNYLKK